jgi:acyl-CoA dehydrogenase
MNVNAGRSTQLLEQVKAIAKEVAGPAAAHVDHNARFPSEAIAALKKAGLMSAYIPEELGGAGVSLTDLVAMCETLSKHCASTAMIFAMHQIQVICIAKHAGASPWFRDYLKSVVKNQNLIASVTSEVGVGGEMRTSLCAVKPTANGFDLIKDATTVSYGAHADDLLITARRSEAAPPSDQVLVLTKGGDYSLELKGTWDTMGMRGTCSPSFLVSSRVQGEQIMGQPFAEIASQTMVPVSHLLWSGCWLGTAAAAVSKVRAFVRFQAKAKPGSVPPTAVRLAEVASNLQALRLNVQTLLAEYERLSLDPHAATGELTTVSYALRMNNLKLCGSQSVAQIVTQSLAICGIQGYKNDSKFAMSRHMRDAYSAQVMVGNDRILATNAGLQLIIKDE